MSQGQTDHPAETILRKLVDRGVVDPCWQYGEPLVLDAESEMTVALDERESEYLYGLMIGSPVHRGVVSFSIPVDSDTARTIRSLWELSGPAYESTGPASWHKHFGYEHEHIGGAEEHEHPEPVTVTRWLEPTTQVSLDKGELDLGVGE